MIRICVGQAADGNMFIKLLLTRKFSIMYVLYNDINEILVIIDKDDKQLDDC